MLIIFRCVYFSVYLIKFIYAILFRIQFCLTRCLCMLKYLSFSFPSFLYRYLFIFIIYIYILNSTFEKVRKIFAMTHMCATTTISNIYRGTYMYQYVVNVLMYCSFQCNWLVLHHVMDVSILRCTLKLSLWLLQICFSEYRGSSLPWHKVVSHRSAYGTNEYDGRGGDDVSTSLAGVLERLYSDPNTFDTTSLVVVPNKYVKAFYVDVEVSKIHSYSLCNFYLSLINMYCFFVLIVPWYISLGGVYSLRWSALFTSVS